MTEPSEPDPDACKLAIEAAGHAVYMTDPDATITYANPAFEAITGYAAEEAIGQTPAILNSGEHPEEYFAELWETILGGETWEEEVVNHTKGGERYIAHQTIAPFSAGGELEGFVAIQTDITDQRDTEQRLRRYQRAIEGSHDLISATDRSDHYLFANPRYRSFHEIEDVDVTDLTLADVFAGAEYETVKQHIDRALAGEEVTYRMTRTGPTGHERTFDIRYYPLEDSAGDVLGVVATMRDVTELVARTEALEQSRELLTHTEELAAIGGWELDLETETLHWTAGTRQLHEVPKDYEPTVEAAIEFYHPDDREEIEQAVEQCRERGIPYELEARLVTDAGRTRWIRTTGERIERDGAPLMRGAIKDITGQKQREQRLMVLNRVLRHNLRNNLSIVVGYADLIEDELDALQEATTIDEDTSPAAILQQVLETADLSAARESDLTQVQRLLDQLASFPYQTAQNALDRIQTSTDALIDITHKAHSIEQSVADDQMIEAVELRPQIEKLVAVYREDYPDATIEIEGDNPTVRGNRNAINRIVEELLENALKHADQDAPTVILRVHRGNPVLLQIADTGPGIPEIERQTIETGEETALMHGSGIGLWLVNWLVTNLGGTVRIEDNEPRGTVVNVELPAPNAE